jgi:hypothetical protein
MRLGATVFLIAVTALVSYSLGRQDARPNDSAAASTAPQQTSSRPAALVAAPPVETVTPEPPRAPLKSRYGRFGRGGN